MIYDFKKTSIPIKIILTLVSNLVIGIAMAMMHYSNVGADPITVLIGGIAHRFQISIGMASTILNTLFFLFVMFFNTKQIKGATILSVLTLGVFMEFGLFIITPLIPNELSYIPRVVLVGLASCVLGLAIGFYLSLDFGASPTDGVMLWFHKMLKINYNYCIWIFYTIAMAVGMALGGVVGLGTMVSLCCIGTCCGWMNKKINSLTIKVS